MDPDILEAFEVRSDIRQLGGRRDPHKSQFAVTRQRLINHLKSLNLAKIIIEIPDTDNQSFDGDQILASLHGIIRQSYPTVYMSR